MKPSIEMVDLGASRTLMVRHLSMPYFDAPYHFHPEYELTYIVRGYGQRFVGDRVERFEANDFVLLGPNLAHFWRSDADFYDASQTLVSEAIVVQFSQKLVEELFTSIPEFRPLKTLLEQADRGLAFQVENLDSNPVYDTLWQLPDAPPPSQMLLFLQIITQLSHFPDRRALAGIKSPLRSDDTETKRMARILDYTISHFKESISLATIAEVASLSEAAFCRYFRQRTQKTYFAYLNELRVSHARQLLIRSDLSITQVAFESGFKNLSYFHRIFRKSTQYSPLRYRHMYHA